MNLYSIKTALADALCVKETSPIIQELFSRFVTPFELLDANEMELTQIKGIGPARARQIVSALKLARALNTPRESKAIIRSPKDVFDLMRFEIGHLMHEEFWILQLSTKNHVIANNRISVGSLNAAVVHPREVFRAAISRGSASIIACHNHPSGDCTPSPEDIALSARLKECGDIIGIEVLDSLVISTDNYYSLKESGQM